MAHRSTSCCSLAGWGVVLHIFVNYDYFINRIIYIDELTLGDKFYAVLAILIVLEATRRVIGWALPLTALVFLAYAVFFTAGRAARCCWSSSTCRPKASSARRSASRRAT